MVTAGQNALIIILSLNWYSVLWFYKKYIDSILFMIIVCISIPNSTNVETITLIITVILGRMMLIDKSYINVCLKFIFIII